jgi:hypothetical protein
MSLGEKPERLRGNLGTESFIGVYPNPSAEYFTLKVMNLVGGNEVRVFDDLGRMVEQFNVNSTQVFGKNLSSGYNIPR